MSYILDALRRAEAERERGAVPSLQSQQHTVMDDDATPTRPRSLVWVIVALAIAVLVLLAWTLFGGSAPQARAPVEGSITTPAPAVAPAVAPLPTLQPSPTPPMAAAPAPPSTGVAAPPDTAAAPAPATPPTAPSSLVAVPAPAARPVTEMRRTPAAAPAKRAAATTAAASGAATSEPRVHPQSELPDDIRRDLPKLVIGGSSYSGDAASRMVMINGQVFHEGDRLGPDLVLERIRLKSAVLAFKGWRYEVQF